MHIERPIPRLSKDKKKSAVPPNPENPELKNLRSYLEQVAAEPAQRQESKGPPPLPEAYLKEIKAKKERKGPPPLPEAYLRQVREQQKSKPPEKPKMLIATAPHQSVAEVAEIAFTKTDEVKPGDEDDPILLTNVKKKAAVKGPTVSMADFIKTLEPQYPASGRMIASDTKVIAKDKIPLEDMRYHRPARAGLRTERHTSSGSSERLLDDSDFVIGDEPDDVEVP